MEPYDRRTVRSFRSLDDIQKKIIDKPEESTSDRNLQGVAMVRPRLIDLKYFSDFCANQLGPVLDLGVFWGLLGLLLTVSDCLG